MGLEIMHGHAPVLVSHALLTQGSLQPCTRNGCFIGIEFPVAVAIDECMNRQRTLFRRTGVGQCVTMPAVWSESNAVTDAPVGPVPSPPSAVRLKRALSHSRVTSMPASVCPVSAE